MPEAGAIRILIAEDDDNARALLVELLNTMGHVVVAEVNGGREAIERAKDVVPDVVLLTMTCSYRIQLPFKVLMAGGEAL